MGKNALVLVEDLIPGILKLKMDGNLKGNLNSIEERDSITSEYMPISENEYIIKCKIVENNKTLFEVQLYAGSREQAKFISDNWKENAILLYPKILKILSQRGRFLARQKCPIWDTFFGMVKTIPYIYGEFFEERAIKIAPTF